MPRADTYFHFSFANYYNPENMQFGALRVLNKQDDWTRFLQIWILPPANGLPVRYENHKCSPDERLNRLLQIVGNPANQDEVPLHLNQYVNLYVSEITDEAARVTYSLKAGRQAYVNNFEGSVDVSDVATHPHLPGCDLIFM